MDITFAKDTISTLTAFGFTASVVGSCLLVLFICFRARSAHPILAKVWLKLMSGKQVDDPKIQHFLDNEEKVYWFQFMTAVYPETVKKTHALIDWCTHNDVPIRRVRECGSNFDVSKPGLRARKGVYTVVGLLAAACTVVLSLTGFASGLASFKDLPLMQGKRSETYFWLSPKEATTLFGNRQQALNKERCSAVLPAASLPFTAEETVEICGFFDSKTKQDELAATVLEQKFYLAFLSFIFVVSAFVTYREFRQDWAAHELLDQLERQSGKPRVSMKRRYRRSVIAMHRFKRACCRFLN